MYLTLLLVDFFHEDWSARSCELRSQGEPFRVQMRDYRPLRAGATGLNIGAENIVGDGWEIRLDSPYDPVDRWLIRSDEDVRFEIEYSGVTPPMAGIGAYNLVLPRGWRFDDIQVDNPNHCGPDFEIGRDNEADQEALMLYFEGSNTRFNLTIQATRGSRKHDHHDLGVAVYSRHIVEPSPADLEVVEKPTRDGSGIPEDQRRPWMVPPLDRMVERPELASSLVAALTAPDATEVALTTGLHGAGGFGKTQMATWISHLPEVNRRYSGGLLWVTVGQNLHGAALAERINDLTFVLSGVRPAVFDPDAAGAELGRMLDEHREPVLLIVDDVWDERQLRPFRSGGHRCTRLVTTRIPQVLPVGAHRIVVDAMSHSQARQLAADGVAGLSAAAADRLARLTGRWPVLLNLVNGALRRRVQHGQPTEQAVADIVATLTEDGPAAFDPARPSDRSQAVAATVDASLDLLEAGDRRRYLDLAIFPEDVEIPREILALLWPRRRVEALCEDLAELGLAANYRLDSPGPRLVLHDVMRSYLRSCVDRSELVDTNRRLIDAAAGRLPVSETDGPAAWWQLPKDANYLWRYLAYHLAEAGASGELAELVCDLRWAESKILVSGSAVGVEADLALADTPTAAALRRALQQAAHLVGPIDPPTALGATLASRLHGVPDLQAVLNRYRAVLPRPLLDTAWPLPDRPDASAPTPAGHTGGVTSCAFSPDGTLLATSSDDSTVRIWQVADGTEQRVLTGHTGGVWSCAFSPDGTLLASAGNDRTVRLWHVETGIEEILLGHGDWVRSCAFSPDGTLLATASDDSTVRIWQVADGTEQRVLTGHTGGVWSCAFSPDGTLLASAGNDRTVRLWHVETGAEQIILVSETEWISSCAFSPDGNLLATVGNDQAARLWQVEGGTELAVLAGHTSRVWDCAFSPDGGVLATTSIDGTTRLWDVATASTKAILTGHASGVRGCVFSPDGSLLATTSNDLSARLWEMPTGIEKTILAGQYSGQRGCAFSPDGTLFATTSNDHKARLWQVSSRTALAVLTGHAGGLRRCAFSPDGTLLATTSNDCTARLWQVPYGKMQKVLTGHTGWVRACAFSPDGSQLATSGGDRTVRLWLVTDGSEVMALAGHTDMVNACAFCPDGTLLASGGDDGTARLWRLADGAHLETLTGHGDGVNACEFSPDGRLLATASDDRTVRLWQIPGGAPRGVLTGHSSWVDDCAFSPDGDLLATAGNDGTVRVWQISTHSNLCAIRVAGPLLGIAWQPGARRIGTVGSAGTYVFDYHP
jgi:WD40 repeat protein